MLKRLSRLCPVCLFFLACLFASATQTRADSLALSFTTTGVFSGSGTNSITYGSGANTVTLTFVGANQSLTNPPAPVNSAGAYLTNYGHIDVTVTGTGATITPGTFTLQFSQTVPSPGGASLTALLSGTITPDSSTALLRFNQSTNTRVFLPPDSNFAFIVYTLEFVGPGQINILAPNVNGGTTNINGVAGPVPEPATLALLGTGLAGLAAGVRRRRRRR